MAEAFTDEEIDQMKEWFTYFDTDFDACITFDELIPLIRCVGQNPTDADVKNLAKKLNPREDKTVLLTFDDFLNLMSTNMKTPEAMQDELRVAFSRFDPKGEGYASADDLRDALTSFGDDKLTIQEFCQMIAMVDTDQDGYINYEEFVRLMTQN